MNVGLIGYGFMGGAHLAAFSALPGVTVTAVASRTRPSADSPARGNLNLKSGPLPDTVRWLPDWQQIVRDPTIDAIDICLPTPLHRPVILEAFAHGKHVLCEKPMALTPADCDHLLHAAQHTDRVFMIAQVLRFMFPYRTALDLVRSTPPGGVQSCTLHRSTGFPQWSDWLGNPAASGGALLDLLSHDLDQALLWFGEPATVRAISLGPVDTAAITLRYPSGLAVEINGGWLAPDTPFSAAFDLRTREASLVLADDQLSLTRNGHTDLLPIPEHDPYADEIAYFVACCRQRSTPALCPPAESAQAVRLAALLERSRTEIGRELPWL